MNYHQICTEHDKMTGELVSAQRDFEDLRHEYDTSSVKGRPRLESDLNAATGKVESAQKAISDFDNKHAEYAKA